MQVRRSLGVKIDLLLRHAARHDDDGNMQTGGAMTHQFGDQRPGTFAAGTGTEDKCPDLGVLPDQVENFLMGLPFPNDEFGSDSCKLIDPGGQIQQSLLRLRARLLSHHIPHRDPVLEFAGLYDIQHRNPAIGAARPARRIAQRDKTFGRGVHNHEQLPHGRPSIKTRRRRRMAVSERARKRHVTWPQVRPDRRDPNVMGRHACRANECVHHLLIRSATKAISCVQGAVRRQFGYSRDAIMTAIGGLLGEGESRSTAGRPRRLRSGRATPDQEISGLPEHLRAKANLRNKGDGIAFLGTLPDAIAAAAFFDPQYRGLLDNMAYGNEGVSRGRARTELPQMDENQIRHFVGEIARVLQPTGHLFLWLDKFGLLNGFSERTRGSGLTVVDLIAWDKERFGMGYRTRRQTEYLVVYQKPPKRAKGVWTDRAIPDVWQERRERGRGTHAKPVLLQRALIHSVTKPGDCVIDPAAGSFSVLSACEAEGRNFLGCDING